MSVPITPVSVFGCSDSRKHSRVRGWVRALRWYLRELSGEAGYEHYLAAHAAHAEGRHAAHHPPMTRREFERWRVDRGDTSPGTRCC